MKLTDAEVRELFQRQTARDAQSDCVEPELLVRAAEGTLPDAERERVAAHIAGCSDCAREFRMAGSLVPVQAEPRTAWFPVAASILLALSLSLLTWLFTLRQGDQATIDRLRGEVAALAGRPAPAPPPPTVIAEAPRPRIDIDGPIVDLDADVTRGGDDAGPAIDVPSSANAVTLILHLPRETSAPIDVEIGDRTERVAGGKPRGSVTVGVPRALLAEGTNAVRLRWNEKQTTYRFRIHLQ